MLLKLPAFILSLNIRRFWLHTLFWSLFWGCLLFVTYSTEDKEHIHNWLSFFLGLSIALGGVYSSFYLYEKYMLQKKYIAFAVLLLIGLVFWAFLGQISSYYLDPPKERESFGINFIGMLFMNLVGFGAKFSHHGVLHIFKVQQLRSEQMESELKHLRSQVNPHFLFNTLNNLYATNLEDPEKANEIILQLADLMRYQLHSAQQQQVNLAEEVEMLENYISLEKIRIHNVTVEIEKQGDFLEIAIAPLLLLPLVENAFKHGTGIEASRIAFKFVREGNTFEFTCTNPLPTTKRKVHSGQVGLENVRKRLSLLYLGKHHFTAQKTGEDFVTSVKITL